VQYRKAIWVSSPKRRKEKLDTNQSFALSLFSFWKIRSAHWSVSVFSIQIPRLCNSSFYDFVDFRDVSCRACSELTSILIGILSKTSSNHFLQSGYWEKARLTRECQFRKIENDCFKLFYSKNWGNSFPSNLNSQEKEKALLNSMKSIEMVHIVIGSFRSCQSKKIMPYLHDSLIKKKSSKILYRIPIINLTIIDRFSTILLP